MRKARRVMIAKRDGGLEPFQTVKLRRCLAGVMRACRYDERLADALARAVELHLREWSDTRPATTDYIFRCLGTVLVETGMEQVAHQLSRHRRWRARQRRAVAVFKAREPGHRLTRWRKATVAAALEHRHGLSHAVARILAGEIEKRVLALKYSVVSAALVAELIQSELLAWGLADAVESAAPAVDVLAERQARKEC